MDLPFGYIVFNKRNGANVYFSTSFVLLWKPYYSVSNKPIFLSILRLHFLMNVAI